MLISLIAMHAKIQQNAPIVKEKKCDRIIESAQNLTGAAPINWDALADDDVDAMQSKIIQEALIFTHRQIQSSRHYLRNNGDSMDADTINACAMHRLNLQSYTILLTIFKSHIQ